MELIGGNYITTLTVLFRNVNLLPLPDWFSRLPFGDWPLYLWLMRNGDRAYYLKEDTGVYRAGVGVFKEMRKDRLRFDKSIIEMFEIFIADHSFEKYKPFIQNCLRMREEELMSLYIYEGYFKKAYKLYSNWVNSKNLFSLSRSFLYALIVKSRSDLKTK